jgi:type IV pilus assembly protein PilP
MKQDAWIDLLAYVLVAIGAVGMAFLISIRFLAKSHAQNPPPAPAAQAAPAPTGAPAAPAAPATPPTAAGAPAPAAKPAAAAVAAPAPAPAAKSGDTSSAAGAVQESASAVAAEVQGFLEPFIYDAKNRRDPFQPYTDFRPTENQPTLSPLQRFDLDDLHLVGIMWDVHNPKAMFLDPDKQVHVAGRDESIGRKNGYIAVIREGEVVVVESSRKDGEVQYKPRVLRMER